MQYLSEKLIDLIIADYYNGSMAKCLVFKSTVVVHEQVVADTLDTFQKFGYEQAKGVFINEVFK